jgi:hypothetical protein
MSGFLDFLMTIQNSPFGTFVRESDWAFPTLESIHVVFLTTVFGSIILLDLRLTGLAFTDRKVSDVTNDVMKFTWWGFLGAAISGLALFTSYANKYAQDPPTIIKFSAMALAGVNMLVYEFLTHPGIGAWDKNAKTPTAARVAGWLSIALWVTVIFAGRWIGFTTQDQNGG